jgi:hypothetical protein
MNYNERKFNMDIASVCGLREAVIADFIRDLELTSDDTTVRHGYFWVRCSQKMMTVHMPFLTEDMVRHSVRKLVDKGILKVAVFNNDRFDHTPTGTHSQLTVMNCWMTAGVSDERTPGNAGQKSHVPGGMQIPQQARTILRILSSGGNEET